MDKRRMRHGSCHCGAVRFAAEVDLAGGTLQCNCSLCSKQRSWVAIVPRAAFSLLEGETALSEYRCNTRTEAHRFCSACGVRVYHTGTSPRWGEYVAVSVACLDDITDEERAAAPVTLLDGKSW